MSTLDPAVPAVDKSMLAAQNPHLYAYVTQRFVSLPESDGTRAWVVDLRDPFHPIAQRYDTWSDADAACERRIIEVLTEMVAALDQIA